MKNSVARYLITALENDAARVASDQYESGEFDALVMFAKVVETASKLLPPNEAEDDAEYTGNTLALEEIKFGYDTWFECALAHELGSEDARLPEDYHLENEVKFRERYKDLTDREVPILKWNK